MKQDHWTAAEYRQFLETGKEPVSQQQIEEAWDRAEREGRVIAIDIVDRFGGAVMKHASAQAQRDFADGVMMQQHSADRDGRIGPLDILQEAKGRKYRNEKITENGITFDSKHEWRVYRWLKGRRERGELRWVFVHVPFRFMSGVTYWADFFTVLADGTVEAVWDAKSVVTARNKDYVIKKKLLLTEWGIVINEVKRSDSDGHGGFYNPAWQYAHSGQGRNSDD